MTLGLYHCGIELLQGKTNPGIEPCLPRRSHRSSGKDNGADHCMEFDLPPQRGLDPSYPVPLPLPH